jgi:hypothetical protein
MASREPVRLNSVSRSACAFVAAALLLAPVAGTAATLSQVRIGTHEDHTRIVLELDEATSYRLTPPSAGNDQLQIQLDASSAARHVPSRSPLVKAVRVTPSARGATVFVDLAEAGVGVSEMILSDPARIVLDLSPGGTPVATRAETTPSPAPSPAATAVPEPTPEPTPSLAEAAEPATPPTPVAATADEPAPSLSDPVPSDVADAQPAAQDESAADAGADTAPVAVASAEDRPAAPLAETDPEIQGGDSRADAPSAGAAAPGAAERPAPLAKQPAEVVVRKPAAEKSAPGASQPASADPTWLDRLMSPIGYAAIGIVLLALVMVAVRRRRHDEDDDPLYSVMSAEDAGDVHEGEHAAGLAWNQPDDDADDVEDANAASAPTFFDDEPIDRDGAQQLSLSRGAGIDVGSDAADDEPEHVPGAFLREPEPAVPLPISDEHAPSFQPEPGDVAHLAAALGDRVQELERRLEQLTEARERLERQVAAQTEELRVQRAAIARTQRVVRSMTKGEDLATEPVPRAPQA